MTYIFNIIFCVSIMQVFLHFFAISFKLSVNFFLKIYCKTDCLLLIKKVVTHFDKTAAYRKKSTEDPREQSITEDPEEESITEDSKRPCQ